MLEARADQSTRLGVHRLTCEADARGRPQRPCRRAYALTYHPWERPNPLPLGQRRLMLCRCSEGVAAPVTAGIRRSRQTDQITGGRPDHPWQPTASRIPPACELDESRAFAQPMLGPSRAVEIQASRRSPALRYFS